MRYSALIGKPTEHSVSHIMYEELASAAGVTDVYKHLKIDVEAEDLPAVLQSFKELKFLGINVTLPYKMEVMQHLDSIDETVNALGAVNTISFGANTVGYNTDWIGITTPISNELSDQQAGTVLIFGTGGAARAAIYAARQLEAKRVIVLYRATHAQELGNLQDKSETLGIELLDYSHVKEAVAESDIVINATSAGMVGRDSSPFEIELLASIELKDKLFFDVVFNPLQTPLMQYFNGRGSKTIDGLWMMIYQGVAALSIWIGQDIEIADEDLSRIHNLLEESLNHA